MPSRSLSLWQCHVFCGHGQRLSPKTPVPMHRGDAERAQPSLGTYCSALMYSLSMGMHITLPTRTPQRTSSNLRPRFSPVMVRRVPPCLGPVSGDS